ncbi:zinc finger protein basonuclin-2-like [Siniperca chuatsi]|uniref:zinc finger protein basonuclin-2-like n=1 Tax=Siniperca chuatsi TaxID=119488 RepID=UPI001CE02C78|nr:zinc finger protein basonuclin-2-like [Siniperca chuatsi]XP_044039852.1 zinc finger protein basonuclin-2-like [Siniperca chuatsi]XP_044039853.1 zinc finger protein basonuclin-2-like [Siniperca chuatsi]
MRMTPDTEESIRCTASGCSCVCFKPGSVQLRSCDRCGHGWVAHALEKLQFQAQQPSSCGPVEVALPGLVFDLSSLVLYGAQAVPVRLKILLDRLYSILTPEQVGHILHTLGWSLGDYVRGYMLQYPGGKALDRWLMVTPEEELLILKQFLRFGETRPIVELMTRQCLAAVSHLSDPQLNRAPNISTVSEGNGGTPGMFKNTGGDSRLVTSVCRFKKNSPADHNDTVHHFENFPGGQSLLLPFHFPSSAFHCLIPSTKEFTGKLTQCLWKPSVTKLAERHRQEGGRREQEDDPILQQSKRDPALKIKADPDKPNPAQSIRHQNPGFHNDPMLDLHRGMAKQENASSLSPSFNSSLIPTSSSLHPSISSSSSSPPKISQKLQGSSSYSLNPLPSFSSSFLCPLPTSSFSSSLHPLPSSSSSLRPLPSSLCSIPSLSPAGGRKGRVCCGVCGKSFYDKGTLKIHYNAVHLKIKHRCTVAGCTMVFSSLRSRNRHSANPNPRLHTGASRDAPTHRNTHTSIHSEAQIHKDKSACKNTHSTHTRCSNTLWPRDDDAHTLVRVHTLRFGLNGHTKPQHGCQDDTHPQADSPPPSPHPLPRTLSQDTNHNFIPCDRTCRSDLYPQAPPPPPRPLLPAGSASSLDSPPSLVHLVVPAAEETEHCRHLLRTAPAPLAGPAPITVASKQAEVSASPLTNQQRLWESGDPMPKKKPRKSSMPVKIEMVEGGENKKE